MAKKVFKGTVIGIDNSLEMLKQAKKNFNTISNLIFQQADATIFKSDTLFTKVVALCSLSWMLKQQEAYQCISKVLMPGGTLTALVSDNNCPLIVSYRTVMTQPQWKNYFENYKPQFYPSTEKEILSYLMKAQFSSALVQQAEIPSKKMNKETFLKAIGATPGVKDVIPQEKYELFLSDVVNEYMKQINCEDENNIEISNGLWLVIATKK